jgi:hypothetical protein
MLQIIRIYLTKYLQKQDIRYNKQQNVTYNHDKPQQTPKKESLTFDIGIGFQYFKSRYVNIT